MEGYRKWYCSACKSAGGYKHGETEAESMEAIRVAHEPFVLNLGCVFKPANITAYLPGCGTKVPAAHAAPITWRDMGNNTWLRSDSNVAVAKHFRDDNGWFIQTYSGGMVDSFTSAEEAMRIADREFPAA